MAAIAAAEVARSARIGVIILVKLIASKFLVLLDTTMVLPGSKLEKFPNNLFL